MLRTPLCFKLFSAQLETVSSKMKWVYKYTASWSTWNKRVSIGISSNEPLFLLKGLHILKINWQYFNAIVIVSGSNNSNNARKLLCEIPKSSQLQIRSESIATCRFCCHFFHFRSNYKLGKEKCVFTFFQQISFAWKTRTRVSLHAVVILRYKI